MDTKITKIQALPEIKRKARVAAYARVSSGKDAMLHSLSYQVSYYSKMIQGHDGWEFAGIYSDEAISGTKVDRENFNRMIGDCRAKKIDLVITKSISRFARNTVVLLETVRELKLLGVDVYFEEQNIHTMSGDGELMISILAGFAQEEAKSVSENMKWRIRKNFEEGQIWCATFLGYRLRDRKLVIEPSEADTVRLIFQLYIGGMGFQGIAKRLTELGRLTRFGNAKWDMGCIRVILKNNIYMGELLLQKTYKRDYIEKRSWANNGCLPKYHVEGSHEAIVSKETFMEAQEEMERRTKRFHSNKANKEENLFKGKVRCGVCGWSYIRKKNHDKFVWTCARRSNEGKPSCSSKNVPEEALIDGFKEALNTESFSKDSFDERVRQVVVYPDNLLVYELNEGDKAEYRWAYKSRSLSWTDEMKQKASIKAKEHKEETSCRK